MTLRRIRLTASAALLIAAAAISFALRSQRLNIQQDLRIYIPSNATYNDVVDTLNTHGCINSLPLFHLMTRLNGYQLNIRPGSYLLHPQMGIITLCHKLSHGRQDPIRLTIGKHRTLPQLCSHLGSRLEFHADTLLALLSDDTLAASFGHTPATIIALFTQNTYEVYWNIDPLEFIHRMQRETDKFWDSDRCLQLETLGLSRQEAVTIASIVEEETNCNEEKDTIAAVYLNRLRIGMPLQADPTVKFAVGDFSIRRITGKHLLVDSPYNTYRHRGLPPGPICLPSIVSIDAVLQPADCNYIYFCAKETFDGRHNFASSLADHARNAARFHAALNKRGIK